jgi:hypothetical protein
LYGYGTRHKLGFSLGKYTRVFQTEAYAIKTCTVENLHRDYKNRNICLLLDSHAAIRALDNYQINSKLVWGCHQSLMQLTWVPRHKGTEGNETGI